MRSECPNAGGNSPVGATRGSQVGPVQVSNSSRFQTLPYSLQAKAQWAANPSKAGQTSKQQRTEPRTGRPTAQCERSRAPSHLSLNGAVPLGSRCGEPGGATQGNQGPLVPSEPRASCSWAEALKCQSRGLHLFNCWIVIDFELIYESEKMERISPGWKNHRMTVICSPSRELKLVNLSYFNQDQVHMTNCFKSLLLRGLMTVSQIHLFFSSLVCFQKK